jgi:F0F1-type ATP synthase assembly protein I
MLFKRIESKPIRAVMRWQIIATAFITVAAGLFFGAHAAVSALLGGVVNQLADFAYAMMVSGGGIRTAGGTLRTLFRAEATRIVLIVLLLGGVLTSYRDVVHPVLFLSFVVSVIVFRAAILVRD